MTCGTRCDGALTFAAFVLLPLKLWPLVALGVLSWEMLSRPLLYWVTIQSHASPGETCSFRSFESACVRREVLSTSMRSSVKVAASRCGFRRRHPLLR
jgi:hypothetical protein